ncbi:hypothetical protein F2P81_019345 [Scophthalmus maximus]|uniref:Uncharacterized protein n=1 Tax=Scophthalmus maximus TaxID=52904 RepID=A0A6A4S7Q4_SCOMX|nr:hypothetical protein F2P81_019345 [Scophthalmus maximus]
MLGHSVILHTELDRGAQRFSSEHCIVVEGQKWKKSSGANMHQQLITQLSEFPQRSRCRSHRAACLVIRPQAIYSMCILSDGIVVITLPEMEHLCGGDGGLRTPKGHDDKRQADEMFREDIKRIQKDLHSSGRRTSTEQNQLAFVCRRVEQSAVHLCSEPGLKTMGPVKQQTTSFISPREKQGQDSSVQRPPEQITFPPGIYYKIFTHRPITDVCASSPKDYTQPGLRKPVAWQNVRNRPVLQEDRSGWYQRIENNSWRLFCSKVVPIAEPIEFGENQKMDFHHSRLQRQQDVERWRRRRKMEWLRQMYTQGRLQTHPVHGHVATLVRSSAQEVMETVDEKGEHEEWELDELLTWTTTLSYEK